MKKFFLVPLAASIALAAYACGTGGQDSSAFDAGIPDGGKPEELPDSYVRPTIDANFDSAPPPVVTVAFADADGNPVSGQNAYFYPGNATAPSRVTSDSTGNASLEMSSGAVTFLVSTSFGKELTTVLALAAGDVIHVTPLPDADFAHVASINGTIADPTNVDAGPLTYFEDLGGCPNSSSVPGTNDAGSYAFAITRSCIDSTGNVTVLFTARAGGAIVAVAPKQVVAVLDAGATLNVAASDWQIPIAKSATIMGAMPAWATSVTELVDSTPKQGDFAAVDTQTPPLAYPGLPSTFAFNVDFDVTLSGQSGATTFQSQRVQRLAATTTLTDDVSTFLPQLNGATTGGTATAPQVSWTLGSALTTDALGALTLAGVAADASEPPFWFVAFPVSGATTSITLPPVPADLASYVAPTWTAELSLITTTSVTYAAARAHPGALIASPETLFNAVGVTTFDAKVTSISQ